jgi:lipopolysaccharide transport system ATP-binding protein
MSSDAAIKIRGVSKTYRIYDKPHHRLLQGMPWIGGTRWYTEFQALRRIDLDVARGETVGIIGRNGSGKSTLLQIICGTLHPTAGQVVVNGRIAALLELGAGFNPEFTGRENVFLNGAVLGLSRAEMESRLEGILAFADIGEFVDRPVKTYSSGMYIRLAFAVAISTEPSVLVIDEALSVGDEAFQRKCFARIEALKDGGCTILFVSHSAGSIVQLCDRAVVIDDGESIYTGQPKDAVALYQRLLYAPDDRRREIRAAIIDVRHGVIDGDGGLARPIDLESARVDPNDLSEAERFDPAMRAESTVELMTHGARIVHPHFRNRDGREVNVLVPDGEYSYTYDVVFEQDARNVHFGMMIRSLAGVDLFGMASHADGEGIEFVQAGSRYTVQFKIRSGLLPGTYFTNAGVMGMIEDGESRFLHRILDALMFKIEVKATNRRKAGFYDLALEPACEFLETSRSREVLQ